jgi:hypothetical protein
VYLIIKKGEKKKKKRRKKEKRVLIFPFVKYKFQVAIPQFKVE